MMGLDVKYSVSNAQGQPESSKELVICNWDATVVDSLF